MLAYVDRLPSFSAFMEASAQDDEVAEMWAAQDDDGEPIRPRIIEWTPERAELVAIRETLQVLQATVVAVAGGKAETPTPALRPETAAERLAKKVEDASYDYLLDRIAEAQARGE